MVGDNSIIPEIWKRRMVKFLPKVQGVPELPIGQTRTISISQPIPAICDSCATQKLYETINPFIGPTQFGGKKKHSPEDAMNTLRLVIDFCDLWTLTLIIILLDLKKAFDSPIPEVLIIIFKRYYGIDGNLLRWVANFIMNNILIIKDNNLYSGIYKTERSDPQGADEAMILWNGYYHPIINKLENIDAGITIPKYNIGDDPLFIINEKNEIEDIEQKENNKDNNKKNKNNNLVDVEFDETFGYGVNMKDIDEYTYKIIMAAILFCDDTSLVSFKPSLAQKLINLKTELCRQTGLLLHPLKPQRLTIGRKYLNEEEKEFRNYIYDINDNNVKKYIVEYNEIGAKLLGHKFGIKNDTRLNFNPHIKSITKTSNNTTIFLNNFGLNRYVQTIYMKSLLFKSLIMSKCCY